MKSYMTTLFSIVIFLVLGCCFLSCQSDAEAEQYIKEIEESITKYSGMEYLLYLPEEYSKDNKKMWPLILFLHGSRERGNDIKQVLRTAFPKMLRNEKDFQFIVLSPQCARTRKTWSNEFLSSLLDEVISHYRIDEDRIYVTGLSGGGRGTWFLALEYPHRFAAIAPICCRGWPAEAERIKHLPVWVFHNEMDQAVPVEGSVKMVNALKSCGGNVRLTIYTEYRGNPRDPKFHDAWTETYNNPELYEWFLQHQRQQASSKKDHVKVRQSNQERQNPLTGQHAYAFQRTIDTYVDTPYLIYLPKEYKNNAIKRWPLILYLHGNVKKGRDIGCVKKSGLPRLIEEGKELPFIVVSPPQRSDFQWSNDYLDALIHEIISDYRIDDRRIYVTGWDEGARGTWGLAIENPRSGWFAAIVPICGEAFPEWAHRIKDLPVWVFHGVKDGVVPIQHSEEMVAALKAARGNVKFTVYPEAGHACWRETYDNPELYDWLLNQKKQ